MAKLIKLRGTADCPDGRTCPAVHQTETGSLVIIGNRLREDAERGLHNRRVHVMRSPLTPYERYECEWGYAPNSQAGEDIRILDLAERATPDGLVDHDFWLMDDHKVVVMHYDGAGQYLGATVAGADQMDQYRHAAAAAWDVAEPFGTYWAAHPQYQRERAV